MSLATPGTPGQSQHVPGLLNLLLSITSVKQGTRLTHLSSFCAHPRPEVLPLPNGNHTSDLCSQLPEQLAPQEL